MLARHRLLVVTVLVVALAPACSGGKRLTRADFQERANKECGSLQKASDEFAKAQAPGASGTDVAKYLHAGAEELRKLVDRLDRLAPPSEMEDGVDDLLELLSDYADGLDKLSDRSGSQQTFQDVLHESSGTVKRLNNLAERASTTVAELGLIGCILPG